MELLAPAGNMEKLKTAIYFGADAVYLAGKSFGLRAFAGNFDDDELKEAAEYVHKNKKKIYITVNIVAHNSDFEGLDKYLKFLQEIKVDGVIVSDWGVMEFVKKYAPNLDIHVSTQANVTNKYTAKMLADYGVKRIIIARELSLKEIKEIRDFIPKEVQLEAFVHGAMCISYSGRCLLSNYLSGRDSNRGACVQACRWEYTICEKSREGQGYEIQEDKRGTYILNSKDLNMLMHLRELVEAGVDSFKIEGRMKSPYYVANIVNVYRRAIEFLKSGKKIPKELEQETTKSSHRNYTTGFFLGANDKECLEGSLPIQTHEFMALVIEDAKGGKVLIEQRNRFAVGEELEVLSPNKTFNKKIIIEKMENLNGEEISDAKNVQERLYLYTDLPLKENDILRKKV
ncbi:MAG: U32 family peptidase [Clostridia bacterium]|nr:U32 family peptidase [Clostridia bacterium]